MSGHFVIESDGPQGEAFLQSFHVPPTPTVISARGPHRYLLIPPGYAVKTTHFGELDIVGDGDQVIGPGSRHVTGHVYHWHDYLSLKEVEPIYPPERLLSWLTERGALQRVRSGATQTSRRRPMNTPKVTSRALSQWSDRARGTSGTEHRVPAETAGGVIRLASTPIQDLLHPTRPRSKGDAFEPWLADLAKKPALFDALFTFLGLGAVPLGKAHLCTLHREHHPSAVLTIADNGYPVYLDLHADDDDLLAYTMPDYYRAQLLGRGLRREEQLHGPSLMPWWERLLVEMGELSPVPVPHRPLPESALQSVHRVYAKFLYLLGCKWLYEPNAPTTFSVRFGREWCGIGSHTTFLQARTLLVQHRYIDELPPMISQDGQRLTLYRPGAL